MLHEKATGPRIYGHHKFVLMDLLSFFFWIKVKKAQSRVCMEESRSGRTWGEDEYNQTHCNGWLLSQLDAD